MVNVKLYNQLIESVNQSLLYAAPWWLDAVCGKEGWDVAFSYNEEKIKAALPYHVTKIRGLNAVITPPLTQFVTAITTGDKQTHFDAFLLHALPKSAILDLSIKPPSDTPLGDDSFPVNLRYSYIIPPALEMTHIRIRYNEGLKRNFREAEANFSVEESNDIPAFLELCRSTHQQRNMKVPAWLDYVLPRAYHSLQEHQCGAITVAKWQNKIISGILTAWDQEATYYLAGGRTTDDAGASAHVLLLDHAINQAQQRGLTFDFEGSMHQGIANFFQSFGAVPSSYWQIRKFRGLGKLWSLFH